MKKEQIYTGNCISSYTITKRIISRIIKETNNHNLKTLKVNTLVGKG